MTTETLLRHTRDHEYSGMLGSGYPGNGVVVHVVGQWWMPYHTSGYTTGNTTAGYTTAVNTTAGYTTTDTATDQTDTDTDQTDTDSDISDISDILVKDCYEFLTFLIFQSKTVVLF